MMFGGPEDPHNIRAVWVIGVLLVLFGLGFWWAMTL